MDLNKLRTFVAVVESGSFSKTAARLGRTQPAISQAVRELESGLGLALLERKKGRVYLTAEGEALFRSGARAFRELEDQAAALKQDLSALTGSIRIGATLDHGWPRLAGRLA